MANSQSFVEKYRLVNLLASYGIKEPVLSLFEKIPRLFFVEDKYQTFAYEDRALPTLNSQTISQPSLVATTLQALELKGTEKVLEIGTGSGFQTALLSKLSQEVYSIERIAKLANMAKLRLKELRFKNTFVVKGDGSEGYLKAAPYDVILVTASFWEVPKPLIDQLKPGGKLIMPVGRGDEQKLILYKKEEGQLRQIRNVSDVRFVPFVGRYAWHFDSSHSLAVNR